MTPTDALLVALAGAAGAWLRHTLTSTTDARAATVRTATLNVVGSGALGAATVLLSPTALLVVGGGLLGSLTTFSTWMVQAQDHDRRVRVVLLPVALGVAAAALGRLGAGAVS